MKLGFIWHVFVSSSAAVLCLISYLLNSYAQGDWQYPWLAWAIAALGIGVLCHYLAVFGFGDEFRQRLIAKELGKQGIRSRAGLCIEQYLKLYREAERKMVARLGFYWHAVVYLLVNFMCILTYILTSIGLGQWYYPWYGWSVAGLSLLLFSHYLWIVLFRGDFFKRLVEREMHF
jgi:hypothetical protein